MIILKEIPNKTFETKAEALKELKVQKHFIIAKKKAVLKEADSVLSLQTKSVNKETNVDNSEKIKVEVIVNTTNFMDSHNDVHLKGIWKKTLQENKNIYLLQEHKMTFDHIISDDVKAEVKEISFEELGQPYKGTTEALTFFATIDKNRNAFMFEQYSKGFVKEHSVGMKYVKLELAVKSDDPYWKEENETYEKYIEQVANKEEVEELGYFWAVTEAKLIEGSAVVKGSNSITPTISVEAVNNTSSNKNEPSTDTQIEQIKRIINKI